MAFRPIQQETGPSWLTPRMRTVISRGTMLIVGLLLIYAGYKCISVSLTAIEEAKRLQPVSPTGIAPRRRLSGAGLPMLLGIILSLLGVLTAVASMIPVSWMECLRPKPPVTSDVSATVTKGYRAWWPW